MVISTGLLIVGALPNAWPPHSPTGMRLWDMIRIVWLALLIYGAVEMSLWRIRTIRDTYTMGYRHGRHDANKSLLEAGVWLSDAAERDAKRELGEEENGV
jgi:hypothetical protein